MITISSNGSKWAGEEPDTIEDLIAVMAQHEINAWGDVAYLDNTNIVRFNGNFETASHVFSIDTDEPATIAKLKAAFNANRTRYGHPPVRAIRRARTGYQTSRQMEATSRACDAMKARFEAERQARQ